MRSSKCPSHLLDRVLCHDSACAAGPYGSNHWMISMRLPSGSWMKKRSAPGIGVVSCVSTPRSANQVRAAATSGVPQGEVSAG